MTRSQRTKPTPTNRSSRPQLETFWYYLTNDQGDYLTDTQGNIILVRTTPSVAQNTKRFSRKRPQ